MWFPNEGAPLPASGQAESPRPSGAPPPAASGQSTEEAFGHASASQAFDDDDRESSVGSSTPCLPELSKNLPLMNENPVSCKCCGGVAGPDLVWHQYVPVRDGDEIIGRITKGRHCRPCWQTYYALGWDVKHWSFGKYVKGIGKPENRATHAEFTQPNFQQ